MVQYEFIAGVVFRYFMDREDWYFCGRYSVGAMFRDHSLLLWERSRNISFACCRDTCKIVWGTFGT